MPSRLGFGGKVLVGLLAAVLLLTLALAVGSFPAGVYALFFTNLADPATSVSGITLFVGPLYVLVPLVATYGSVFAGLTVVYAGLFAFAAWQERNAVAAMRGAFSEGFAAFFTNPLLVALISTGFLAFSAALLEAVEAGAGVPVGSLPTCQPAGDLLMGLTIAPLREELGFRVVVIGLLAALLCLGRPWKTFVKAFWRPSVSYQGVTSGTLVKWALGLGVAGSSVLFGVAHLTPSACGGQGWDIGKVPEAAYAGVVIGFLYVKYGLHVAILVHWGIDYLGSAFAFLGQGVAGIQWASEPGYFLQQIVSVDMLLLLGLSSFLVVSYVGVLRLLKRGPPDDSG